MSHRTRRLVRAGVLTTTLIGLIGLAAVPASSATHRPSPSQPPGVGHRTADPLSWQTCADAPGFDCGTLRVPIDWRYPSGATVDLAVVRHRASDPTRRIGALVVNPGGPGGSGVDEVESGSDDLSTEVLARFDLVGWDPRGVGRSHPVRCDASLVNNPVSLFPTTEAGFEDLVSYNTRLRDSCRAATGPLYDHLDSASSARDLDALRAALGEDRLTFSAISYGTLIGEQYAELFPTHIRAIALDSTEDHSVGALAWVTALSQALEQSYGQFADWCRRADACALHPDDAREVLDRLYTRAQQGTITVPGFPDNVITPETLLDFIRGELRGVSTWPDLAENLLAIANEPAPARARHATVGSQPTPSTAPESTTTSDEATKTAIFCEDHQWNVSSFAELKTLRQAMARVAPHTHMSTTGFKDVTGCLGWTRPVANPQHRLTVHDAPPILMVNSRFDVATPYPGALRVAEQIGPAAVLLTYDGTSHVDYVETDCVRTAVDRYLVSLTTPGPHASCPAVFPS